MIEVGGTNYFEPEITNHTMGLFGGDSEDVIEDELDVGSLRQLYRVIDPEAEVVVYVSQSGTAALPLSETSLEIPSDQRR